MPTTTVKTVKSGGDYTSWQAFEDASPSSVVSSDIIWEGQQGTGTLTGTLVVSGTTTDATRFLRFTTEAGASFRDAAGIQSGPLRWGGVSGAAIDVSGDYVSAITCNQAYTEFIGLQVRTTAAHSAPISCQPDTAGMNTWDYCILDSAIQVGTIYGNVKMRNSLLVANASSLARILIMGGSNTELHFCTLIVPSSFTAASAAFTGVYSSAQLIKSCAIFGVADVVASTTGKTFTTCYTDDPSPPTGCTTATYSSAFENTNGASLDLRVKAGSGLIDVGTIDATNGATDIAKSSRPQGSAPDAGCWELVAAASAFIPIIGRGPGLALAGGRGLAG